MGVTFVTAFYLPSTPTYRKVPLYISLFEEFASTGVPIILYLDSRLPELAERLCKTYANIQHCYLGSADNSFLPENVVLPAVRNFDKDTSDYMCIQLMKLKVLAEVEVFIQTSHIAWIDFGIYHMFNDKQLCRYLLNKIAYSSCSTEKILSPACYTMAVTDPFNRIYWNHCGSFLLGKVGVFASAYDAQMALVKNNLPQVTWEVNYWCMMSDHFTSYMATHNELLLKNVCDYIGVLTPGKEN
jgi:hypothetical protein